MTPDTVMSLARETALLILILAGPILGAGLLVGLAVSVFQAVTQIQEMTLSFIPKLLVVLVILGVMGHWMLGKLLSFTVALFSNLDTYAR